MAENMSMEDASRRSVVVTHPASPVSGDPVRYGEVTGVALVTEAQAGNPTNMTSVDFGMRQWRLPVKGINAGGNSAVAPGDKLFYTDADTPPLSKKATGVLFGVADEAVTSGGTATIKVTHSPA